MRACMAILLVVLVGVRVEAAPPTRPADVVATVSVTASSLAGVRAYANAVSPGAGASIDPNLVLLLAGASLKGVDTTAPMHVVVGNAGGPSFITVVKVADMAAFSAGTPSWIASRVQGNWVAVGTRAAVDVLAPWALATLPAAPAPRVPTATLYSKALADMAKPALAALKTEMVAKSPAMKDLADLYVDAFASLVADADTLEVRLEADADLCSLDIAAIPRAGTRLAQFVAAQKPSDFGLLAKLPAQQLAVVFAGRIASGPYRDAILAFTSSMYGKGAGSNKAINDALVAIMKAASGEIAVGSHVDPKVGQSIVQLFTLDDPKAVDAAVATALRDIGTKGVRVTPTIGPAQTWTANATPVVHDGVTLRGYRIKLDAPTTPEEKRSYDLVSPTGRSEWSIGVVETKGEAPLGLAASGPDGAAEGVRAVDAVRGKATRLTLGKLTAALVENARVHRDSMVFTLDASALPDYKLTDESPFAMTAGFADGAIHTRMLVPSASVRAMVVAKQQQPPPPPPPTLPVPTP